jgi:hypothetical protein
MIEQIHELIRKNLPAEVGDQLRKHLADFDACKRERDQFAERLGASSNQVIAQAGEITKLKETLAQHTTLAKREADCLFRENRLGVIMAENRAMAAEVKAAAVFDLASLVFRNPVLKRTVSESSTDPIIAPGTSYPSGSSNATKSKTETEEVG